MKNIGMHTSVKSLLQASDEFFEEHKVFQVFVGSPRTLQVPSFTDLALFKKRHPEVEVIVHMPYVVNLCKNNSEKCYINTLSYMIRVAKELDKIGINYMVTHIGGRSKEQSIKDSTMQIWNFCQKWLMSTMECKIKLCLENDSGSKANTKMGHMNVLSLVVRRVNDPRIRMCFDSEHAYAAGFNTTDVELMKSFKDVISVVHLNSVPAEVVAGGHLDRHSSTSFYDSKVSPIPVLEVFDDGDFPFIMEVESPVFMKSNLEWLKENNYGR